MSNSNQINTIIKLFIIWVILFLGFGILLLMTNKLSGMTITYYLIGIVGMIITAIMLVTKYISSRRGVKIKLHEGKINLESSKNIVPATSQIFGSGFYTPIQVVKEINEMKHVKEVWFALTNVEDTEEPYYSMINNLVNKGAIIRYFLEKTNGGIEQIDIDQVTDLINKIRADDNINATIRNKIDKVITYSIIPDYVLTNNLCFINPRLKRAQLQHGYGTIRDNNENTVLIYKMPHVEFKRNLKRLENGIWNEKFIDQYSELFNLYLRKKNSLTEKEQDSFLSGTLDDSALKEYFSVNKDILEKILSGKSADRSDA